MLFTVFNTLLLLDTLIPRRPCPHANLLIPLGPEPSKLNLEI